VNTILAFPSRKGGDTTLTEPQADEAELVRLLREGDRSAAEELVTITYQTIYASLFRLCGGDGDLAADLTQESYRRAWAALPQFRGGSRFSTWLYRIAYTTFLNHVRRPRRVVSLDEEAAVEVRDVRPDAEELLSGSEQAGALRRAVLALPEDLRFTVTAHFWGELEVREIAELENVTGAAIRKRLHKAFDMLGVTLGGEAS
jgi:RNA polymerase sigma-70 factor (ECF subfamily)